MRNVIIFCFIIFCTRAFCQGGEFKIYDNGLIYSEATMASLKQVADSLNLKYLQCDIDYQYSSMMQTKGHYIEVRSVDLKAVKMDLSNNITFEDFIKKYPSALVKKDLLIVQFEYLGANNIEYVDFESIAIDGYNSSSVDKIRKTDKLLKGGKSWVFESLNKNEYWDDVIWAFYFPDEFSSTRIPEQYANMIGYSNCMIDTTTSKILKEAEYGYAELPKNWRNLPFQQKENLLNEFRHTIVRGTCSMDTSPRIHAKNIALLSSETANWKVFLKAHLDILNDNFRRMSDASHAMAGRNTYLKEIEALDINTLNLLFGTLFRINSHAEHHYFGNPHRMGRALADAADTDVVESLMAEMIKNKNLDHFNRILVYRTFQSYIHHLEDEKSKVKAKRILKKASRYLPEYIRSMIED